MEFAGSSDEDTFEDKAPKKAEILKFEILFPEDQDVHMRQQAFKVSLKMLMSYFY